MSPIPILDALLSAAGLPRPGRAVPGRAPGADDTPQDLGLVGPDVVVAGARHVRLGDGWAATLAATGYPAEVGAGWLEPLLAYPGRLDVAVHIEPVTAPAAADRLKKQRARLESTRRQDYRHGRLDDPEVDAAAQDAADLADRIARGDGKLFRVGLYLTVHAGDQDDLAAEIARVRSVAASMLLTLQPATWRAVQGWTTSLPLAVDRLRLHRTMDTAALAASFPFTSPDLPAQRPDPAGGHPTAGPVLYGTNTASPGVVVWDRWSADNHNSIVLARSGAGKSYFSKLDLLRNLYQGVTASVIDPENEYTTLTRAVGGTTIALGRPGVRLNPLDLDSDDPRPDALARRSLFCHTLLAVLLGARLDPDAAAALDRAVTTAYHAAGITTDPRTWRRRAPLLPDLAEHLAADTGPAGPALAARLAPYTTGAFSTLFTGPTTTRPDGHLVTFTLRDVPDELTATATLLALDATWRRIATGPPGARRLCVVDEAWLLLRDGIGADWLFRLAKRARKYTAGLSLITQDVGDVLASDLGRAVCSNAATQVLLRQAPQAIDTLADAFALTAGERGLLTAAARGDGLLIADGHRVGFHALASPAEHTLVAAPPEPATDSADHPHEL